MTIPRSVASFSKSMNQGFCGALPEPYVLSTTARNPGGMKYVSYHIFLNTGKECQDDDIGVVQIVGPLEPHWDLLYEYGHIHT